MSAKSGVTRAHGKRGEALKKAALCRVPGRKGHVSSVPRTALVSATPIDAPDFNPGHHSTATLLFWGFAARPTDLAGRLAADAELRE